MFNKVHIGNQKFPKCTISNSEDYSETKQVFNSIEKKNIHV